MVYTQDMPRVFCYLLLLCFPAAVLFAQVLVGVDVFFQEGHFSQFQDKRIGLITNHTGVSGELIPTAQLFLDNKLRLTALFNPEHGLQGSSYADEKVNGSAWRKLPVHSLHGETRRPTAEMLKGIDVLVYDIQCIGVRTYTYSTTLFYAMEEAAKLGIEVVVLDRPNPINGLTIDGPMLDSEWRSFIGYINVPYCHGMTIGELAQFFNEEYQIGCKLKVIPMKGWRRSMSYAETGLAWIPPSPHIPESDTPFFYPSTGIFDGLQMLNIGVGYTLPFKIAGAPWINALQFTAKLNEQKLPGVQFVPFHFKPFFGLYKGQECQGALIRVTDPLLYRPLSVQFLLLGMLKSLYPKEFTERLAKASRKKMFHQANGTDAVLRILTEEKYPAWKLIEFHREEREAFKQKRKKYLLPQYS